MTKEQVKAWMIVNKESEYLGAVHLNRMAALRDWKRFGMTQKEIIVPCTITYTLP